MRPRWIPRVTVLLTGLLAALTIPAGAETVDCQRVMRLPFTIARSGVYCLGRNLTRAAAVGTAITVDADDVVLDLNGWTLDGSAAGLGTQAVGIRSTGRSNITIRNGTVRGFFAGIQIGDVSSSTGHVVEKIRAERNTAQGIFVAGRGAEIRRNQVLDTGGSTLARGSGIIVNAPGGVVAENLVVGTFTGGAAPLFAYGIHATQSDGLVIEGNRILNNTPPPGTTFGIIIPFSENVLVTNNRITNTTEGVTYTSFATGRYRDNLTSGVAVPYNNDGTATPTDAGNNQ